MTEELTNERLRARVRDGDAAAATELARIAKRRGDPWLHAAPFAAEVRAAVGTVMKVTTAIAREPGVRDCQRFPTELAASLRHSQRGIEVLEGSIYFPGITWNVAPADRLFEAARTCADIADSLLSRVEGGPPADATLRAVTARCVEEIAEELPHLDSVFGDIEHTGSGKAPSVRGQPGEHLEKVLSGLVRLELTADAAARADVDALPRLVDPAIWSEAIRFYVGAARGPGFDSMFEATLAMGPPGRRTLKIGRKTEAIPLTEVRNAWEAVLGVPEPDFDGIPESHQRDAELYALRLLLRSIRR